MPYEAIQGTRALYANLDFLQRYFGTDAMPITMDEQRAVAEDIASEARRLAPVKTGALRAGIEVIPGKNQTEVYSRATYSLFVEFGTVKTAAQPFLRPAYHKFQYFLRVSARHRQNIKNGLATP